jgi:hypothetical protein
VRSFILLLLQHLFVFLLSGAQVIGIGWNGFLAFSGLGVGDATCGCMVLTCTGSGVLHIPDPPFQRLVHRLHGAVIAEWLFLIPSPFKQFLVYSHRTIYHFATVMNDAAVIASAIHQVCNAEFPGTPILVVCYILQVPTSTVLDMTD